MKTKTNKLSPAIQNASIVQVLEMITQCVRTGKDMTGKAMTSEELARSLRTLADVVEGKTE